MQSGGPLNADLVQAVTLAQKYYGLNLARNQAVAPDEAIAKFAAAMPVSFQYLTGLSMSAEEIIRQNALANSMKRGVMAWASKVDATAAAQDFALARAEAERRTAYSVLGELAAKMLPVIKNILEAFIYAVFPIVALFLMLPIAAKAAFIYVKMLVWIQLWAPIYAVLHSAVLAYSRLPAEAALTHFTDSGDAVMLSLANYTGLGQVLADHAILAGYLTLSIPMVAYMLVSFSGSVAAGISGRILQSYEGPVSKAADEAAGGNLSLGNTSMGNASWWAQNAAPRTSMGTVETTGADGRTETITTRGSYVDVPTSSLPFNANLESGIRETTSRLASEELGKASQRIGQYGEQTQASLQTIKGFVDQLNTSSGFSQQFGSSETASLSSSFDRTNAQLKTFARENGLSESETARLVGSTSAGLGTGASLPIIQAGLSGSLQNQTEAQLNELVRKAAQFVQQTGFGNQLAQTVEGARQATATYSGSNGFQDTAGVQSAVVRLTSAGETTSESVQRAERFIQAKELAETGGVSFGGNANDIYRNYTADRFLDGNVRRFDELQQRAARGDSVALGALDGYRSEFLRDVALRLAGVGPPPNGAIIETRGRFAVDELLAGSRARTDSVAETASTEIDRRSAASFSNGRDGIARETESAKNQAEDTRSGNATELFKSSALAGAARYAGALEAENELKAGETGSLTAKAADKLDGAAGLLVGQPLKNLAQDLNKPVRPLDGRSE